VDVIENRYTILEQIGTGGMGAVFLAEDTRLQRKVAIKRLVMNGHPMGMQQWIQRFEREALEMASFQHPNIVSVHDFGRDEQGMYLVLEHMAGGSLSDKLRFGRLPICTAVNILLPLADALQVLHDRKIVHRDVKPSNILFDAYGTPKLADFGMLKMLEHKNSSAVTATDLTVGTPAYMAPELIDAKTSPAIDQYALTVVLYEMVTGNRPYTGATPMATLIMQRYAILPDPLVLNPNLPEWVCAVIKKGMAKEPEQRYENMRRFADAIRKYSGEDYTEESTVSLSQSVKSKS
jgi:serine/threonine protein kinase